MVMCVILKSASSPCDPSGRLRVETRSKSQSDGRRICGTSQAFSSAVLPWERSPERGHPREVTRERSPERGHPREVTWERSPERGHQRGARNHRQTGNTLITTGCAVIETVVSVSEFFLNLKEKNNFLFCNLIKNTFFFTGMSKFKMVYKKAGKVFLSIWSL